jgi:uncharacterized protein YndB with AHSA1/START domain
MQQITVSTTINEPIEKVWAAYTEPQHITKWAFADDSWHAPKAENDLRAGGRFLTRMEAKDGSIGFDFSGSYTEVMPHQKIAYTMDDNRTAIIVFEELGNSTHIQVSFDPENENPIEMQKAGWQAILENFKKYAEQMK